MSYHPLHILFVSAWFPSRVNPYAGDYIKRHAKAVSQLNQVSIVFAIGDDQISTIEKHVETSKNYKEIIYYYPQSTCKILNFFRKIYCLQHGFQQLGKVDLIHSNVVDYYLLWVFYQKWIKNIPFVYTEHWTGFYNITPRVKKWLAKLAGKWANYVFPVSHNLKEAMIKKAVNANYKVIPNVIETALFYPIEREEKKIPIFFHLSMLKEEHKNISGQLRVVQRLSEQGYDFEYHIGGNGDNQMIKDFVETHELAHVIKTFGALTHQQVAKKMRQADCFVLFSNYETQGIVCLESFACGVPVIATKVGGLTENFQGNYGILVDKGNEDQLAQAMISIIKGKQFAPQQEMFRFVHDNYSPTYIAHTITHHYKMIMNSKH